MNTRSELENPSSRVAIFVDVQNMFFSAKSLTGGKVDYKKLLDFVSFGRTICAAKAYLMFKTETDTKKFESMLYLSGFDIKKKTMELRQKESGNMININSWDIGMTIDMIKWAEKVDTIILVTGSGVFVDAVNYLKNFCRVEIAAFEEHTSKLLRRCADDFIDLSPDRNEFNVIIDHNFKEEVTEEE